MRPNFFDFARQRLQNYIIAVTNICIFLPYFFSVKPLFKTLFKPWKNLTAPKKTHESMGDWGSRISFNVISGLIGAWLRLTLILMYVVCQVLFVLILPLASLLSVLLLPLLYMFSHFDPTENEKKQQLEKIFIQQHLTDSKNAAAVQKWFEWYYETNIKHNDWWQLKSLLSIPAMARDWTYGYTPTLDEYVEDLTFQKPHYKNLVDRVDEIAEIEQILSKSEEHNCIIVGDEGVGKHTIVEGLAKKMYEGKSTPPLVFKRVLKLDLTKIIASTTDFAAREETVGLLLKEAATAGNIIILIDNFDRFVSADAADRIDLSTTIEPYANSPRLQIIGITTPHAYQKYVIRNEKISVLFQKVAVSEIKKEDAQKIMLTVGPIFESRFNIIIPYEALTEIVAKSDVYITAIPFPEKAIDLLDEVCVYATETKKTNTITPDMVDSVLAKKTHSPVQLDASIKNKLLTLDKKLKEKIIAQDEGIEMVSKSLRKSFVTSGSSKKPLATMLFLGPTGVGKTETAKALTQVFFNSEDALIRFDMSLYQTKQDIPNLIGSQDSGNPGLLSSAIREHPYGVLLIDEIEKADRDLLNIFLTVLDEGYFNDGFGNRVDCHNLMVIATSNAGADFINDLLSKSGNFETEGFINYLVEKQIFLPEFLNRFDGVVIYKPLDMISIRLIANQIISSLIKNIETTYGIHVSIQPEFIDNLIKKGYDIRFGARNMSRIISTEIEDKIAKLVLENKAEKGSTITF